MTLLETGLSGTHLPIQSRLVYTVGKTVFKRPLLFFPLFSVELALKIMAVPLSLTRKRRLSPPFFCLAALL